MIINIDAFRKNFSGTEDEIKSNVIYKENDRLSGRQPIEFVRAVNPIVIIDEPQSVDNTDKAQEAIKSLNPLCTLRYSATHINPYNLVYKLDPIRAFELGLVKQIVVGSAAVKGYSGDAFIKLNSVNIKNRTANITIQQKLKSGIKEKKINVKQSADIFDLSNSLDIYKDGFIIREISFEPGNEYIEFNNNQTITIGNETGSPKDDIMKIQIRNTIKKHLEKERQVKDRGIKVLSLFFIDRVANYRSYDSGGKPVRGKFSEWFEEYYKELTAQMQLNDKYNHPIEKIHDGYFAQDKKGILKDTNGNTSADEDVYNKIMKNKEQLLSMDEPLRFIFSHSALREGWDNPNVFQICTLNETKSTLKKRQEIGRGLRIPVNQFGERVFDENLNKLLIIANESYDDFARKLQSEYETDCGVTFGKIYRNSFAKIEIIIDGKQEFLGKPKSESVWNELLQNGFIDSGGIIQSKFDPSVPDFSLGLGEEFKSMEHEIISIMESSRIDKHIKKDEDERPLKLNKQIYLDKDFEELWNRIKAKTTYSVQYKTDTIIENSVNSIKKMEKILPVEITYHEASLGISNKGIETDIIRSGSNRVHFSGALPDILSYLERETNLTRSTLSSILVKSKRLNEFAINPQRFMDSVSEIIKRELHKLIIDGIKYEKISNKEYSMRLFETEEVKSYLNNRLEVRKSIYDAIVYDSEIERKFAEELDKREDIKLFVKLPPWFKIETPIGEYNPDWAVLKHDNTILYMVRETKGTKNFELLRNIESEKIHCGRKHFEELKVDFGVVVTAEEI